MCFYENDIQLEMQVCKHLIQAKCYWQSRISHTPPPHTHTLPHTHRHTLNPNTIKSYKSYKNYLQNTQHMVLCNRPTLIIGTERLACLNSPLACSRGPSPSTRQVPGLSPVSGGRAARAFFSTLPSFLLPEIVFFTPSPPTPQKC